MIKIVWQRKAFSLFLLALSGTAWGADVSFQSEYMDRLKVAQTIQPSGPTPFGESVNMYTGEVNFSNTDVVLSGQGPDIRIARTRGNQSSYRPKINTLADWSLAIPSIETYVSTQSRGSMEPVGEAWLTGNPYGNQRCTNFTVPAGDESDMWWQGWELVDDAGSRQQIMTRSAANSQKPGMIGSNGQPINFPAVTNTFWQIGCLPATSNGQAGEAFIVVSPDGTKYWMDHLVGLRINAVFEFSGGVNVFYPRLLAVMYVSRVEDRFGRWVTYQYDSSDPTKLIGISAQDGRSVSVIWKAGTHLIESISVQPSVAPVRKWNYVYNGDLTNLTQVVLPDSSSWTYDLNGMNIRGGLASTACGNRIDNSSQAASSFATIKSPTGLSGSFGFAYIKHGRSYVPSDCIQPETGSETAPYDSNPPLFASGSLVSKQLSGPGIQLAAWTYKYAPAAGSTTYDSCANTITCSDTTWTDAIDPNGDRTRYVFSTRWGVAEGKVLTTNMYEAVTDALKRSETVQYALPSGGPYPALLGGTAQSWQTNSAPTQELAPVKSKSISQSTATFTWSVDANCSGKPYCFDTYARPTSVTRSSSLGNSRTEATVYSDNLSKWVIGQVASVTKTAPNAAFEMTSTAYDATTALPLSEKTYGKLKASYTWNTDGTLATVKDGNNKVTTYSNWMRGIPQLITHPATPEKPSGATQSAVVDALGQISSVTDENGFTSGYTYDAMGRLASITYPSATPAWTGVTLSFQPINNDEHGLAAGHWRASRYEGNKHINTYYDALWRPVLEETLDAGDIAGTLSQVVKRYDPDGHLAFQSYPTRNVNLYTDTALKGVRTEYDALDRVTAVRQDSELGVLSTTSVYGTGFKTTTTNPNGKSVTTGYMAFDQPTYDWPTSIVALEGQPEAQYTDIVRDVFGLPLSITRRDQNSTAGNVLVRSFTYDGYRQLCKTAEPESGATLQDYDGAGNVLWSASGQATSTACGGVAAANRTTRTYDGRNRVQTLTFPDHRGDASYTYKPDGLVASVQTGDAGSNVVSTTYEYNTRRAPVSETLQAGGNNWSMGYGYNTRGQLATLTYPDGTSVNYAPNALGQPTQAGTYATGVGYYANGAMSGFTYGNGIVHSMLQNTRQLPDQSIDSGGVLNDSYDYDNNGNVLAISDGLAGARGNRDMTYDGLDRLKTTTSKMFGTSGTAVTASFTYDVLDNLRTQVMPATPQTVARNYAYCYDDGSSGTFRLTFIRAATCAGAATIALSYDAQGNLANKNNQLYTFDRGNRLRSMQLSGGSGPLETYAYDGNGRRVMDTHATLGTIWSLYGQDGALRYQRNERTGKSTNYVTLNGSLVARVSNPYTPPVAAPTGTPTLTVPTSSTTGSYTVSWTTVSTATTYKLEESISGTWSVVQNTSATTAAISGKATGTYSYRISACNSGGCGPVSATKSISVTAPPLPVPTTAPTLTVPASNATGSYTVSWTTVSTATTYKLEESTSGTWTTLQNTSATSNAVSGKASGTYSYRVSACNSSGCGPTSATQSTTVTLPPSAAPTVTAPASNTTGSYTVSWTSVAAATAYRVEEQVNGGAWAEIQNAASTSIALSGKSSGTYGYRARGCNTGGCGPYSTVVSTSVQVTPPMPATLTVTVTYDNSVQPALRETVVDWSASAGATSYQLQMQSTASPSIVYDGPNRSYYTTLKGKLQFWVRACAGTNCSAWKGPEVTP